MRNLLVVVTIVAGGIANGVVAQTMDHSTMDHTTMDHSTMDVSAVNREAMNHEAMNRETMTTNGAALDEPGQGGFAAIAEIVSALRTDPATDWTRVNIAALRDHLVDMNRLITETSLDQRNVDGGIAVVIDGSIAANASAIRMVSAHATFLGTETGWASDVARNGDRLSWTITSDRDAQQIRALGFFGMMAIGDHHREHHLAIASGMMMQH